jgi:hypothetical protein
MTFLNAYENTYSDSLPCGLQRFGAVPLLALFAAIEQHKHNHQQQHRGDLQQLSRRCTYHASGHSFRVQADEHGHERNERRLHELGNGGL